MRALRIAQTASLRDGGGLIRDKISSEERLIVGLFRDLGLHIRDKMKGRNENGLLVGEEVHQGLRQYSDLNGLGIGDPSPVTAALRSLNQKSHESAQPIITSVLYQIVSAKSEAECENLIARFSTALKAGRRSNGYEKEFIPPATIRKCIAELSEELGREPYRNELAERRGINVIPIEKFINCIEELGQELGRPPVRDELAKRLKKRPTNITKLCKKTGFEWLPAKNKAPKEWFYPRLNLS